MNDIVERLRFMGEVNAVGKRSTAALAADEIERLRAAVAAAWREGIEAAANEIDCGCDNRDEVLARLEARDRTRASWLCRHGDVCCALQAAEIRTLLESER